MQNLPAYLEPLFLVTAFLSIILFAQATPSKLFTMVFLFLWGALWYVIAQTGFFLDVQAMPPRVIFMMGPVILAIVLFFVTKRGKEFIDRLDVQKLTMLHVVRLPVEITLMLLAIYKAVPEEVTFEGRNFDIVMGLSALPVALLYSKKKVSPKFLLVWNIIGVILLLNVVIHGVLALPYPFQQYSFDQPNVAMLYAPYNLLPGVIVPVVMFSQLAAIRLLMKKERGF
jgi:hypothetical protein